MRIAGKNYIGSKRSADNPATLRSIDATTGESLPWLFHEASSNEIDAAAQAAATAYPAYRGMAASRRAEFLDAIGAELDALDADFVSLVSRETALPSARIEAERGRTSNQLRLFAQVLRRGDFYGARIDRAMPNRKPLPRPELRQYRIGIGPVAVFGASNFPLAFSTAGGDTASALAAGCPVVFKAHGGHMATSECVAEAVLRAARRTGMPDGVFSMIYGDHVGGLLVKRPAIQAVGFTGSLRGGRALYDMASCRPHPIPVFAEMSSVNPVLLLPQALRTRGATIAAELAASVSLGCGQFCTNPGLIIGIRTPEFSAFVAHLTEAIDAHPAQTMLNAATRENYLQAISALEEHAGIRRLSHPGTAGHPVHACLFQADSRLLTNADPRLQEEIFGPATIVVEVADTHELALALQGMHGQLTATLIAEPSDLHAHADLLPLLEQKAGRLLLNGYPTGVEVCDAMVHGGPYPAASDARSTSVGTLAIDRFLRPVCYQNYPDAMLPDALKDANPLGILRLVDGVPGRAPVTVKE